MKTKIATLAAIAAIAFGSGLIKSQANERKEERIKLSDAPHAVQKALKAEAGRAEIVEVEKEFEHGKTVYEAVVVREGKRVGIEVDENGKSLGTHDEAKEHQGKGERD